MSAPAAAGLPDPLARLAAVEHAVQRIAGHLDVLESHYRKLERGTEALAAELCAIKAALNRAAVESNQTQMMV
jgi:hypothetical protein